MGRAAREGRRRRLRRAAAVLVAGVLWAAVAALPGAGAAFVATTGTGAAFTAWVPGVLTQPSATASCTSHTGSGPCTDGEALDGAASPTVSADGSSLYVAGQWSNAVAAFSRSSSTGYVSQLAGTDGCLQLSSTTGNCTKAASLFGTNDIALSADGKHAYVTAFDSNTLSVQTRAAGGELARVAGSAGCVQVSSASGCTDGQGMMEPSSVAISPDAVGLHVYVLSRSLGTLSVMSRNATTGALTKVGCLSGSGTDNNGEACTATSALDGATALAFSPDGTHAYVASSNRVSAFSRSPTTGVLTPLAGTSRCTSESGDAGNCVDGVGLSGVTDVTVSPDGTSVYVTSSWSSHAIAAFSRNTSTGVLTQLSGTSACTSDDGSSGACVDGTALQGAVAVAVSPDGTHVFVAARFSNSLSVFRRDTTTGALTQATGAAGCLSPTSSGCTVARALSAPNGVVVSPDGKDVYVTSVTSDAVVLLTRTR